MNIKMNSLLMDQYMKEFEEASTLYTPLIPEISSLLYISHRCAPQTFLHYFVSVTIFKRLNYPTQLSFKISK